MDRLETSAIESGPRGPRLKSRKWRPNLRLATCEECGKRFDATRKWQRFDSQKCRKANHRKLVEKALREFRIRHQGR